MPLLNLCINCFGFIADFSETAGTNGSAFGAEGLWEYYFCTPFNSKQLSTWLFSYILRNLKLIYNYDIGLYMKNTLIQFHCTVKNMIS